MAMKWAVTDKFSVYLTRPFIIRTDHKALLHHSTFGEKTPKLLRWDLKMQSYQYRIEYKEGSENHVADCLSRVYFVREED